MRLIAATVALCLCATTSEAKELRSNQVSEVSRAYGFMVAQNMALDQIERQFPQLRQEARLARARFASKFGNLEAILADPLKDLMRDKFSAMDSALRTKMTESNKAEMTSAAVAQVFLNHVVGRANGQIPDEYLKPMLMMKYDGDPLREFADGWRQVFTRGGEGKARGVKINIELPKSYGSKESPRPHIVRNWTSENGNGLQTIILDVRETGQTVRQDDVTDEFVKDLSNEFVGPRGELIGSGTFRHETYPGAWFSVVREEERATQKLKLGMHYFMIFAADRAVSIGCTTSGPAEPNFDAKKAAADFRPVCLRVLNSLVLPGAYR